MASPTSAASHAWASVRNALGYVRYRVLLEYEYHTSHSATAVELRRQWWWWTRRFPEYLFPSSLPEPEGTEPEPPGDAVLVDALRRRLPVWWRRYDNWLLFGHTLPTAEEVAYRRSYLAWIDKRLREGSLDPLPIADIERDARSVNVCLHDHPLIHERVWRELQARRFPGQGGIDVDGEVWFWRDFEHYRDDQGRLGVRRPQDRLLGERQGTNEVDDEQGAVEASPSLSGSYTGRGAAEDVRQARADLKDAAADVRDMVTAGVKASQQLQPHVFAFFKNRLQTFSEALAEFSAGYAQGMHEVASGKMNPAKDMQEFWHRMVHTLPAILEDKRHSPASATPQSTPPRTTGTSHIV